MRKGLLITMAILSGCWSAGAQELSIAGAKGRADFAQSSMRWGSVREKSALRALQVARIYGQTTETSWVDSSYELAETPFVQDIRVPVLSLAGGRVQVGGSYRMISAENFQMGLPGAGTLPAWSVSAQSHPAVLAPRMDQSVGLTVQLGMHGAGLREMHYHGYQTVRRAIGFLLEI